MVVLAVVIPWLVFRSDGDAARGAQEVPSSLKEGQSLFQTNCGTCHTLYAAGTDGNYAPEPRRTSLASTARRKRREEIEGVEGRVLNAVENGVDSSTTPGRMPGGILNERTGRDVAEFVARTAGER